MRAPLAIVALIAIFTLALAITPIHAQLEIEVFSDGSALACYNVTVEAPVEEVSVKLPFKPDELVAYGPGGSYLHEVVVNETGVYVKVLYPEPGTLHLAFIAYNLSIQAEGVWTLSLDLPCRATIKLPKNSLPVEVPVEAISVDIVGGHPTITLPRGAYTLSYALVPPMPEIKVVDLSIRPSTIKVGEEASIVVVVANLGDAEGSRDVRVEVDGKVYEAHVTLAPGESKTLTFTFKATESGTFTAKADGLRATLRVKAEIAPPRRPCIIVTAAYGSEMEADVALLRHIRDVYVGSSRSGKAFLAAFNPWYYSWSIPAANMIAGSEVSRWLARLLLTPAVESIKAAWSAVSWLPREVGVPALILASSALIGLAYASPIAIAALAMSRRARRAAERLIRPLTLALAASYTLSLATQLPPWLLTATTTATWLLATITPPLALALALTRLMAK